MFHTTGSFQSPTFRPIGMPLFGRRLKAEDLKAYENILTGFDELDHYGKLDTVAGYNRLSRRAQEYIAKLQLQIKPADLARFKEQGLYGFVEESSDMFFEMYTLQAIQKGLVNQGQIDQWQALYKECRQNKTPFFIFMREIRRSLTDDQVARFQKLTGLSESRSRTMLGLVGCKFALFQARDPQFDKMKYTRPRLWMEALELQKLMPAFSPERLKIMAQALLYTLLPDLPQDLFRQMSMKTVTQAVKAPVEYGDMMKYVFLKQMGRQELDYYHPEMTYNQRKCTVKPFEILLESVAIKNALAAKDTAASGESRLPRP